VKRYNVFYVKLTANSDTEQNNISKSTFSVCVSEHFHIFYSVLVKNKLARCSWYKKSVNEQ